MGHLNAVQELSVWILPIIFAVTLHEAAHGYVALLLGDGTAKALGRISLNPIRHIDPVGTVLFPCLALLLHGPIFGWAKPVPVDFRNLRHPRRDMILVALAGPGTNLLLATVSIALIYGVELLPALAQGWAFANLKNSAQINVLLAIFNMLPIPPLDGGRVAVGILPRPLAMRLARAERLGMMLVIGLFVLVPLALGPAGAAYSPFRWLVAGPTQWLFGQLAWLLGFGR